MTGHRLDAGHILQSIFPHLYSLILLLDWRFPCTGNRMTLWPDVLMTYWIERTYLRLQYLYIWTGFAHGTIVLWDDGSIWSIFTIMRKSDVALRHFPLKRSELHNMMDAPSSPLPGLLKRLFAAQGLKG